MTGEPLARMRTRLACCWLLALALATVEAALPSLQEVLARLHRWYQTCNQTSSQTLYPS